VDYFNKMAELVFATVFDTHMCRKKVNRAPEILENRRFYVVLKKIYNRVRQTARHVTYSRTPH